MASSSSCCCYCCCCQVSKITHQAPIGDSTCTTGGTILKQHSVANLVLHGHHFMYRFCSHWRQIEETIAQDFDIGKMVMFCKYSNFRGTVWSVSVVGDLFHKILT
jgi:hypothetical protein